MDNNTVNNDAIAARRRALAEALRQGEPVVVTPTGEVGTKEEMQDNGLSGIQVPDGKLAKEDRIWHFIGIKATLSYIKRK